MSQSDVDTAALAARLNLSLSGGNAMSLPVPGGATADQADDGEWVVTITNGIPTKIERVDKATNTRRELTGDEYSAVSASCYALYYMGIRDYAQAVASSNIELAQAHLLGMTAFFDATGQT